MTIKERKFLYDEVQLGENFELDWASQVFVDVDLQTIDTFRIPAVMEYRPDLISFKFYGNFHMGWLISLHNNFLDPIFDYKFGTLINIPDMEEYFRYYKNNARRD